MAASGRDMRGCILETASISYLVDHTSAQVTYTLIQYSSWLTVKLTFADPYVKRRDSLAMVETAGDKVINIGERIRAACTSGCTVERGGSAIES